MKKLMYATVTALFLSFSFVYGQELQEEEENCTAGGPGSTSCSTTISGGATIMGSGGEGSVTHEVSCGDGYYSCCNTSGATCKEN